MKLLWQSFLDPSDHAAYVGALRELLERTTPKVEYDVVGVRPPDRHLHALTEVRCGIAALRNALWAERAGYDGIVLGHFQEPFLHEIRASISIPVVGLGESALADARARAETIGLMTIDEVFVPWHDEQLRRHGVVERVAGIRALDVAPDDFMAAMSAGDARERLLTRLEETARPLVEAGAELLVLAGALPAVALCGADAVMVAGVPLQNCVAVAARAAVSARGPEAFSPPPAAAVEEFLAATGGALGEPVH